MLLSAVFCALLLASLFLFLSPSSFRPSLLSQRSLDPDPSTAFVVVRSRNPQKLLMVLNHIFSKSPDKHKTKTKEKEKEKGQPRERETSSERVKDKKDRIDPLSQRIVIPPPPPKSPEYRPSPTGSPRKSSSTSTSPRKSPTKSVSHRDYFQHSRSSSTTSNKRSFTISRRYSSARDHRDQDSHPLNLPPDELRRLTAMATREDARSSMDVEESPSSSNTAPVTSPSGETPNGASPAQEDRSPTPPPHRSSPPAPDAESFKLAGNKFYKAGDYNRAIQEYNKGRFVSCCGC